MNWAVFFSCSDLTNISFIFHFFTLKHPRPPILDVILSSVIYLVCPCYLGHILGSLCMTRYLPVVTAWPQLTSLKELQALFFSLELSFSGCCSWCFCQYITFVVVDWDCLLFRGCCNFSNNYCLKCLYLLLCGQQYILQIISQIFLLYIFKSQFVTTCVEHF